LAHPHEHRVPQSLNTEADSNAGPDEAQRRPRVPQRSSVSRFAD